MGKKISKYKILFSCRRVSRVFTGILIQSPEASHSDQMPNAFSHLKIEIMLPYFKEAGCQTFLNFCFKNTNFCFKNTNYDLIESFRKMYKNIVITYGFGLVFFLLLSCNVVSELHCQMTKLKTIRWSPFLPSLYLPPVATKKNIQ